MSDSHFKPKRKLFLNDIQLDEAARAIKWIRFATLSVGLLCTYFLVIFFFRDTIFGIPVRDRILALAIIISFGSIYWSIRWSYRRQLVSINRLQDLTAASIAILVSLMAVDIGYSIYSSMCDQEGLTEDELEYYRMTDQYVWTGETIPHRYYPTEKNFWIHKPSVALSYETYGDMYYSRMKESSTLVNSVLKLRQVSMIIDEHGFRETTPIEQAHSFALGDSYTFGVSTDQDKIWVELLEQAIGEPIYNLGVSGISPKEELMTLEYILLTKPASSKIEHVLWMIFEGNDLDDRYETFNPYQRQEKDAREQSWGETIIASLNFIPSMIREQSVINGLRTGQIIFKWPSRTAEEGDPYMVDGVRLIYPLYRSAQYGYALFYPQYIEAANKPESYVLDHPNRPLLDQTFKDMAGLSQKYGFKVTVVIAPSAPRLYASYFENFPPISERPYFINYVENLSKDLGFNVINLYPQMQSYAAKEYLYWRDDSHWNERGHEVVAEIIAKGLADYVTSSKHSPETNPN